MRKIKKFEDLAVWQEAMILTVDLMGELKSWRNYGLKTQLERSSISIPSNIAEGFERKSNKEFIQFLCITRGSCSELRTQLYICQELNLINKVTVQKLLENSRKISAMLSKLIETRKTNFSF
jgi:four helix bundle protein